MLPSSVHTFHKELAMHAGPTGHLSGGQIYLDTAFQGLLTNDTRTPGDTIS